MNGKVDFRKSPPEHSVVPDMAPVTDTKCRDCEELNGTIGVMYEYFTEGDSSIVEMKWGSSWIYDVMECLYKNTEQEPQTDAQADRLWDELSTMQRVDAILEAMG